MPDDDRPILNLNAEERVAMEDLLSALSIIQSWKLKSNQTELAAAIHVIQSFIIQHMLGRLAPEAWSNWYG